MLAERQVERVLIPEVIRMRRLYEDQGLSLRQVVAATGRPRSTVHWHLQRAGVELRAPYVVPEPSRRISYEEETRTVELYESGLSMGQVAQALGLSRNAVCHRLRVAGVRARSRADARALRDAGGRVGQEVDDELVRLYRDERYSLAQVAERCGVERGTVRRALDRRGVQVRSLSDAARIDKARRAGRDVMAVPLTLRVRKPEPEPTSREVTWIKRYVPSGPLAKAIAEVAATLDEDPIVGERMIADRAGLSAKLLWSWRLGNSHLSGYKDRATVTAADLVLDALDKFWWEVFDEDDPDARGYWGDV